jgi:hypothetical protein
MSEHHEGSSTTTVNEGNMRSALVVALLQSDPHKTFHLDITPREKALCKACKDDDLAQVQHLLGDSSLL